MVFFYFNLLRSNVTPNAQESEDSGLSLSYSLLGSDAAKQISSSSSSISETDQKELYEDEVVRQKGNKNSTSTIDAIPDFR